jgi:hypothetical protein
MDESYSSELERLGDEQLHDDEAPRRQIRCGRVCDIAVAGGLRSAGDFYFAAVVLMHGVSVDEYATALYFARTAAQRGDGRAWSIVAACWDRWLIANGKAQRYGTQFLRINNTWTVDPVDAAVTDSVRAFYAVPPLWVQRKSAALLQRRDTNNEL